MTAGDQAIPHAAWTADRIGDAPNPVLALAAATFRKLPTDNMLDVAKQLGQASPLETSLANTSVVTAPFWGFGPKTKAFGELPPLADLKYRELSSTGDIEAPRELRTTYDQIARPFNYLGVVNVMNEATALAGGLVKPPQVGPARPPTEPRQNLPEIPSTPGPLDTGTIKDRLFSSYQGSVRLKIWDNKEYAMAVFQPLADPAGRAIATDPLDSRNWRGLSKDEAIDRLHSQLSYQTDVKRGTDSTFANMFENLTGGIKWQPYFKAINPPHDPKFSDWLKRPRDEFVSLNGPVQPFTTTYGAFLKGDIPQNKLETALAEEYAITQPFRQMTGQNISFRRWIEGDSGAKQTGRVSPWQNIGASSFGQRRLADVWYRPITELESLNVVRDTVDWAKRTGAKDVSLVYHPTTLQGAEKLAKQLRAEGLEVRLYKDDRLSMPTMVARGMGWAMKNPDNSSLVIAVRPSALSTGGEIPFNLRTFDSQDSGSLNPLKVPVPAMPISRPPRLLLESSDDFAKIPALASSMMNPAIQKSWAGAAAILGAGDLRSSLLALQVKDRGLDVLQVPPSVHSFNEFIAKVRPDAVVAVQPRDGQVGALMDSLRLGSPVAPVSPGQPWKPSGLDKLSTPQSAQPPPLWDWRAIGPALQQQGFRPYEPPRPPQLPGGVSTKEFARAWVDNGDWPLTVCVPGWYAAPVSLMDR